MKATVENKVGFQKIKGGWIPEDWGYSLLEELSTRGSGHTPDKKQPDYYWGGIKWISLADSSILDKGIIDKTRIEISEEGIRNSSAVIHEKGTVVMSRDAGVGKCGVMGSKMAVSQHFITWFTNEEKYHNWFLYYWLLNQKREFERIAVGSTIKTIGLPYFKKLRVPVPNVIEQQKIAQILSIWDKAISSSQNLIDQLETRKKGLMQQLLTGKIRLTGFDGDWKQFKYEEILKETNRKVEWDDEELYHLISVRRRSGGLFHRESLLGMEILTKNLKTAKEGDFLISKMQIVHGASGLVSKDFDSMKISGSYLCLRSKDEDILDMEFFNWISKTPYFYHQTYVASYGVHIEKMTFNFKSFLKLSTLLPHIKEQRAIVSVLDAAETSIKVNKEKLEQLLEEKKGLMQQLLTGQKRVSI